jgi:hypothetical protein
MVTLRVKLISGSAEVNKGTIRKNILPKSDASTFIPIFKSWSLLKQKELRSSAVRVFSVSIEQTYLTYVTMTLHKAECELTHSVNQSYSLLNITDPVGTYVTYVRT